MDIPAIPWTLSRPPKRVLAIRLQATGDVVITLPYLQELRRRLPPDTPLDFLTREETASIPQSLRLFGKVFAIGGGRNHRKQWLYTLLLLPLLLVRRYEVVIDLQNNRISRFVTRVLSPRAWSQFDRFSPIPAGERNRLTIEAVGLTLQAPSGSRQAMPGLHPRGRFRLRNPLEGLLLLKSHGWNCQDELVLLNPAGAFVTRHWSIDNYVAFARLWLEEHPTTRFLVLGTPFIAPRAALLREQLGHQLIDLTGKTTPAEAFAVLQHVSFALSEDSGLMHMAWTSGIPTLALFGSTRSDWARPLGPHTGFLDSSDLPCGNCMQSVCALGDVRCMKRYAPEDIFQKALLLTQKTLI